MLVAVIGRSLGITWGKAEYPSEPSSRSQGAAMIVAVSWSGGSMEPSSCTLKPQPLPVGETLLLCDEGEELET